MCIRDSVKTLYRISLVILIGSALFGMTDEEHPINSDLSGLFTNTDSSLPNCTSSKCYYIVGTVLIPLNEIFVYPVLNRCLPNVKSYWKFFLGAIMQFGRYAAILALITYTRHQYIKLDNATGNTTLQCLFYRGSNSLSEMLGYRWTVLLESLSAASDLLTLIGGIELYCAQVPYSIKGLVAGIFYGFFGLFMMLSGVISLPFKMKSLGLSLIHI